MRDREALCLCIFAFRKIAVRCHRCAGTVAGGAIGREALDAGTVASGAGIKAGEPGEAPRREPLDAADVPCPSTCRPTAAPGPLPVARSAARPSMPARWRAAPGSRPASPARREPDTFCGENAQNAFDDGGLANAGTAGNDQHLGNEGELDRGRLA